MYSIALLDSIFTCKTLFISLSIPYIEILIYSMIKIEAILYMLPLINVPINIYYLNPRYFQNMFHFGYFIFCSSYLIMLNKLGHFDFYLLLYFRQHSIHLIVQHAQMNTYQFWIFCSDFCSYLGANGIYRQVNVKNESKYFPPNERLIQITGKCDVIHARYSKSYSFVISCK